MIKFFIPIWKRKGPDDDPGNVTLTTGTYRATFAIGIPFVTLKNLEINKTVTVDGKPILVRKVFENEEGKLTVEFDVMKNPIPLAVTILAIAGGITIISFVTIRLLDKVERATPEVISWGILGVVGFAIAKEVI